jgi:hypothetical protein
MESFEGIRGRPVVRCLDQGYPESLGGRVAARTAIDAPEQVDRLVLCDPRRVRNRRHMMHVGVRTVRSSG